MSRRSVQYRHAHHLRPHTLLQLVAEMVEPGHHHLHHRVRQGVQGEQQYLSSEQHSTASSEPGSSNCWAQTAQQRVGKYLWAISTTIASQRVAAARPSSEHGENPVPFKESKPENKIVRNTDFMTAIPQAYPPRNTINMISTTLANTISTAISSPWFTWNPMNSSASLPCNLSNSVEVTINTSGQRLCPGQEQL